MQIDSLKGAKLSPMTAGYLAIYLKLSDLYNDVTHITEIEYSGVSIDDVNESFYDALSKAQEEVMKLIIMSISENLLNNTNEAEI